MVNETEKVPETEAANPFDEFDVGAFFNQYLDSGSGEGRGEGTRSSKSLRSTSSSLHPRG